MRKMMAAMATGALLATGFVGLAAPASASSHIACRETLKAPTDGTQYYVYHIPVATTYGTDCSLRRGDRDAYREGGVTTLQRILNCYGGGTNLALDGSFGRLTEERLISIQKRLGLTPDGRYGPQTRAKLAYPVFRNNTYVKCA